MDAVPERLPGNSVLDLANLDGDPSDMAAVDQSGVELAGQLTEQSVPFLVPRGATRLRPAGDLDHPLHDLHSSQPGGRSSALLPRPLPARRRAQRGHTGPRDFGVTIPQHQPHVVPAALRGRARPLATPGRGGSGKHDGGHAAQLWPVGVTTA